MPQIVVEILLMAFMNRRIITEDSVKNNSNHSEQRLFCEELLSFIFESGRA